MNYCTIISFTFKLSHHLPHFHFRLFITKVRIHIHCRRYFRVPHQILQRFGIHSCPGHICTIRMPAHMRRNRWHLHRIYAIIFPYHMIKIFLPISCHFRHPVLIQEQNPILLSLICSTFSRFLPFNIR